jgi:hypothetical protein
VLSRSASRFNLITKVRRSTFARADADAVSIEEETVASIGGNGDVEGGELAWKTELKSEENNTARVPGIAIV